MRAAYLSGWNVWGNLQDGHGSAWRYGWGHPFAYQAYLDSLSANHLNYIRLWMYETAMMTSGADKTAAAWRSWIWRAFTRGYNPVLLIRGPVFGGGEAGMRTLGDTRRCAERMKLAEMSPQVALASTGYCLANPGAAYLVFQPASMTAFTVGLEAGAYEFEWFDPVAGKATVTGSFSQDAGDRSFAAPFQGAAVLLLTRRQTK